MNEAKTGHTFNPVDESVIRKGVEEFNAGKFFECHDTLEEVWQGTRGEARNFLQGLIQISVGFYHLGNGNLVGGCSQLKRALKNLEEYGERYAGMELSRLRQQVRDWLGRAQSGDELRGTIADLPKFDYAPEGK